MNKKEFQIPGTKAVKRNVTAEEVRPSWMLVRPGDKCVVQSMGIRQVGYCHRIISLSSGRKLMLISDDRGEPIGIFRETEVELSDVSARKLHVTMFEARLKHYEPKGMTTANG